MHVVCNKNFVQMKFNSFDMELTGSKIASIDQWVLFSPHNYYQHRQSNHRPGLHS